MKPSAQPTPQVPCSEVTELLQRVAAGADRPTVIGRRWADVHEGPVSFRMACGAQITVLKSEAGIAYVDVVQMPGGRASLFDDWGGEGEPDNPIDALSVEQLRAIVAALRTARIESHQ